MWHFIGAVCAVAIVGSMAYAVWQLVHGGLQPDQTACLIGLPVGIVGLMVGP